MEKIGEHNENNFFTLKFDLGKTYMLHGILLLQNMESKAHPNNFAY